MPKVSKRSSLWMNMYIKIPLLLLVLILYQEIIFAEDKQTALDSTSLTTLDSTTLTLDSALKTAIENNPEIKQSKSKFESYKIKATQQGVLDEPKFGIGLLNLPANSFSLRDMDETMKEFKLMQMFPFFGKLSLKEEVATIEAKMIEEEYNEKRNEITSKVKKTYYEFFLIIKSIEITEKNKLLLEEIVRITDAKYSSGTGLQSDVLRAQLELAKMKNELIMLEQKRKTAEAKLNSLLFRKIDTSISNIEELKNKEFNKDLTELQNITIENKPVLKLANLMVKKNETALNLAKKEYFPDFDLGVSYGQRDSRMDGTERNDMVSLMLTINLPFLWGKRGYEVESTQIEIEEAKSNYDSMKNEVFFMIRDISVEIEKDKKMINLFETGILPLAKQAFKTTRANYESNKVDFLALLETQMILYKYEIEYLNILVEYEKNLAELEFVIGRSL